MPRNVLAAAIVAAGILATSHAFAEEEPAPTPPPTPAFFRGWIAAGASAGEFWNIGTTSFHGTFGGNWDHGHLALPFTLEVDLGKTTAGLGTGQVALALAPQARIGRVRFGGGPEAGYFWLTRNAGASMPPVDAIGLGLCALASVDLVALGEDKAVSLLARGEVMYLRGPDSFFRFDRGTAAPRGSLALGVRF